MATFTLPYFGDLNSDLLEEYYDTEFALADKEVELDLNFENSSIPLDRLKKVKEFIDDLAAHNSQNKKHIREDYQHDIWDATRFYIQHHLKELDQDDLAAFIDFDNQTINPELQLLDALQLVRVGLYPDHKDRFAVFDYSINTDVTDDLVVVVTDENGKINRIVVES